MIGGRRGGLAWDAWLEAGLRESTLACVGELRCSAVAIMVEARKMHCSTVVQLYAVCAVAAVFVWEKGLLGENAGMRCVKLALMIQRQLHNCLYSWSSINLMSN